MKRLIFTSFFILSVFSSVYSQSQFPSYYYENQFGLTSPGAMRYGLYGYVNPAVLSSLDQFDMHLFFTDQNGKWNKFNNWGLFTAVPHLSFGFVHQKVSAASVTDYKISTSVGSKNFSLGVGFGWSSGNLDYFNRKNLFTFGTLYRPMKYVSFGFIGNVPTAGNGEGALDLAVRPFGNEIVSLFGDYVFKNNRNPNDIRWSSGIAAEVYPGFRITGRYFDTKYFSVGVELSLGNLGISTQSSFNKDSKHQYNVYGIRIGGYDRNPFTKLFPKNDYLNIDLLGTTKYQKYRFFDNSNTLMDLIEKIDAAKNDNSISGIAINLSGMNMNREMIWELRERLKDFKSAGKHVVAFIDRGGIDAYHLASIADKIVMDPQGMITLEGYLWGRLYLKGTLEKLGIGFHEWRYFKYKSALETFSRDNMSEADSIQLQNLVNDYYKSAENDICKSRNLSTDKFNDLVNNETMFLPEDALKFGLVDTLGRWDTVKDLINKMENSNTSLVDKNSLSKFKLPDDNYWGEKPKVAVVYALGECAMDQGIKARSLVKVIESVANNSNVKAVVLRVDSPGGDGMASDIVAEALKKCKEQKPVIVSQGYVAASGGYWLSMYADTIVAAPITITGSIGVIGGWYYNKSFKSKIGVSTDYVKKGDHADLPFGFRLPLIGLTLPDRDLTSQEQQRAENIIKSLYADFINKVASGRNMKVSKVKEIAQGRVWSGYDGIENGLVDVLGGLDDALNIAVTKANLKNKQYDIIELPEPQLINLDFLVPKFFGIDVNAEEDPVLSNLKFRFENNGMPMPILPIEDMDFLNLSIGY